MSCRSTCPCRCRAPNQIEGPLFEFGKLGLGCNDKGEQSGRIRVRPRFILGKMALHSLSACFTCSCLRSRNHTCHMTHSHVLMQQTLIHRVLTSYGAYGLLHRSYMMRMLMQHVRDVYAEAADRAHHTMCKYTW